MAPTVSVIVPAFDAERFLGEALDGVLAQDYPAERVEVIVVDDGSTDATPQIAARYAAADDRIRVVHRPNGGQVAATNTALEHATGDVDRAAGRRRRLGPRQASPLRRRARRPDPRSASSTAT